MTFLSKMLWGGLLSFLARGLMLLGVLVGAVLLAVGARTKRPRLRAVGLGLMLASPALAMLLLVICEFFL